MMASINRRLVILLCCWVGLSTPWIQACRCVGPPSLLAAFQNADFVLQATLLQQITPSTPSQLSFSARVLRGWKGCSVFRGVDTTTISTSSDSSVCGVLGLQPGVTYIFSGYHDSSQSIPTAVSVSSCGFQSPWSSLTTSDQALVETLSQQYTNCSCRPQRCGPPPGVPGLCPDGVTLGGPISCTYNQAQDTCDWNVVQCPACQVQSDCLVGQFCSVGKCRAGGSCANDADCFNPHNPFVKNCVGVPLCTNSICSLDCLHPCPNGTSKVNCFLDPCAVTPCPEPHESCVANYCGGCGAVFFNSSGYQVCTPAPPPTSNNTTTNTANNTTCSSNQSCGPEPMVVGLPCDDGSPPVLTVSCAYNNQKKACDWNITRECNDF